nr:MAG TPA: hypothetical protein [Caudoviricetes sp.]
MDWIGTGDFVSSVPKRSMVLIENNQNIHPRLSYKHKTFSSLSRMASDRVYSHQAYSGMFLA